MSKGSKRRVGNGYADNFDKIFGNKSEREERWDEQEHKKAALRMSTSKRKDFEEFVSPIDQSVISCPSKLRKHNKKHGVTDIRDYGSTWFDKKNKERSNNLTGNTKQAHNERIETVKQTLQQYGVYKPWTT